MFRTVRLPIIRSLFTVHSAMVYAILKFHKFFTMHVHTNVKFVNAKQAKETYQYRNTKEKLWKTNAPIWYIKICRGKQLTLNYISIKINGKNSQCQKTIKAAAQCRLNQPICEISVWHIPSLSVQWINSWWWAEELSEIYRVSWQNKFVKLVHLVGFIIKKFVTMRGHMNVKKVMLSLHRGRLQAEALGFDTSLISGLGSSSTADLPPPGSTQYHVKWGTG